MRADCQWIGQGAGHNKCLLCFFFLHYPLDCHAYPGASCRRALRIKRGSSNLISRIRNTNHVHHSVAFGRSKIHRCSTRQNTVGRREARYGSSRQAQLGTWRTAADMHSTRTFEADPPTSLGGVDRDDMSAANTGGSLEDASSAGARRCDMVGRKKKAFRCTLLTCMIYAQQTWATEMSGCVFEHGVVQERQLWQPVCKS